MTNFSIIQEIGETVKALVKLFIFFATKIIKIESVINYLKLAETISPKTFGASFLAGIIVATAFFAIKKLKTKKAEKAELAKLQERVLQREKSQIQLG